MRNRHRWRGWLALALVLVTTTSLLPPFLPGAPSSDSSPLSGSSATFGLMTVAPAFRAPPGSWEASPLPAATPIRVVIGMSSPTSDWMPSLDLLYAPGSLEYHQFLTPAEFESRFAPSEGNYTNAVNFFASQGLAVTTSPDRLMFSVSGPAEAMGHVFHTEFVEYSSGAGTFFTHTTAASLPAGLGISGVLGLGNATPVLPALGPGSTAFSVLPDSGSCGTTPPFAPCAVQGAYNETPLLKDGTNGTGVRIGIVDDYDGTENQSRLAADLATFGGIFNISTGHVQYLYPVPTTTNLNTTNTGWAEEEALDLEWAHATAPGASIDMTFAPDASEGLYSAVDYLVAHQAVDVLSLSWGEPDVGSFNNAACTEACNATSDGTYALLHPVLLEAAMEGISVLAATGDCGAADGTNGVSTNYPASDPWVTAVGATDLSLGASGGYASETGWSGNASGAQGCVNQGGSGGGYSPFPRPWWQSASGVPVTPSTRGTPDVSMVGGTPVSIYFHGGRTGVEGTSVGTPIWAGLTAVADNRSGSSLGFLNPSLYAVARSSHYRTAFHDVLTGSNGYAAGPGWDPVTGLGSPNVVDLLPILSSSALAEGNLSAELYATPRLVVPDAPVTFHVHVTGGTNRYPLIDVAFGDSNASLASNAEVNHTFTTSGTYAA
ncbi:MAG: protease pro-enzyme activation domain-containing protein, partial [Thermoplasmata archaeon]